MIQAVNSGSPSVARRAASGSVARLGSVPDDPDSQLRLVQDRLALFGKIIFSFSAVFVGLSVVTYVLGAVGLAEPSRGQGSAGRLTAATIAFALWRIARRRTVLPPRLLHALDGAGTLGICVCLSIMGYRFGLHNSWGYFAGVLAVFHTTLAHAIIVPSTPRRTLVVTALSFAGLSVAQYFLLVHDGQALAGRLLGLLAPITLSATATALATVGSKVVYGLQERVIEARQLGQYTLTEKIGGGGMGEVYRAHHALLRRPTAIKLLAGDVSETQLRRFEREVQLTALLTHPNTVSIYDFGHTPDGRFYYAMELIDGITLQELVDDYGAQPPGRVLHILLQACAALREAHGAGLVHRDIKPANIMLCKNGGLPDVVKILDFGLVKQLSRETDVALSTTNVLVGTPLYMSPEAIAAPDQMDTRSDLYALGAVAYFLLTGAPVFFARTIVEICSLHLHARPPPLAERTEQPIPPDLERAVLDCLAKDPTARPASARELAERLRTCAERSPWTESDADAWWQQAQDNRRRSVEPSTAVGEGTMQVDLENRNDHRRAAPG
jgi:eukaryotic-like serine/threonine-protein kinase